MSVFKQDFKVNVQTQWRVNFQSHILPIMQIDTKKSGCTQNIKEIKAKKECNLTYIA